MRISQPNRERLSEARKREEDNTSTDGGGGDWVDGSSSESSGVAPRLNGKRLS